MTGISFRVLCAVLAAAVGAGCTAAGGGGMQALEGSVEESGGADPRLTGAGVPPELLLEPPPRTDIERLNLETRKSVTFCGVMASIDRMEEPSPDDIDRMVDFARRYHGTLASFDPSSEVIDSEVTERRSREVRVPQELVDAIQRQRAAMYAFSIWMGAIDGLDDREGRKRWVEAAFVRLLRSEFTRADRILTEGRDRYCTELPT